LVVHMLCIHFGPMVHVSLVGCVQAWGRVQQLSFIYCAGSYRMLMETKMRREAWLDGSGAFLILPVIKNAGLSYGR
jgi:hypothetical protein